MRKILIRVERTYHHKLPPNKTPTKTNNSILNVGASPKTEAPAKTAMNTTIVTGFDAVRKKRVAKSPKSPFLETRLRLRICLSGFRK